MGRGEHCTPGKRILIKKMIAAGKTYIEVHKFCECSPTVISNALKWKMKPESQGYKRKTTTREDCHIVNLVMEHPTLSSQKIKEELNLSVSTVTIRQRLRDAKLFGRSPQRVPSLSKKNIQAHLKFANEHIEWPLTKWRNILWSDERKVVLFGSSGRRMFVRCPANTAFNPKYTVKTIKHGGQKIMVWGCFSYNGV